jgi:hypothetical protein
MRLIISPSPSSAFAPTFVFVVSGVISVLTQVLGESRASTTLALDSQR